MAEETQQERQERILKRMTQSGTSTDSGPTKESRLKAAKDWVQKWTSVQDIIDAHKPSSMEELTQLLADSWENNADDRESKMAARLSKMNQ